MASCIVDTTSTATASSQQLMVLLDQMHGASTRVLSTKYLSRQTHHMLHVVTIHQKGSQAFVGHVGDVTSWYADAELEIRGAVALSPADGSKTLRIREDQASPWFDVVHWPQQEEGSVIGFTKGGK